MMNTMNLNQITKNLKINEEKLSEMLAACGIDASNGSVTIGEAMTLKQYAKEHENTPAQKAQNYLEKSAECCTIFVDTNQLLCDQFPDFLERVTPLLKKNGKKLLIPSGVLCEMQKLLFREDELAEKVSSVLELLEQKVQEGVVAMVGNEGVTFADQQMLTIATCAMLSDTLMFLTKDNGLSEDILKVNDLNSVQGNKVFVNRINRYGYLSRYITAAEREAAAQGVSQLPPAC